MTVGSQVQDSRHPQRHRSGQLEGGGGGGGLQNFPAERTIEEPAQFSLKKFTVNN